jgi:MFS family permease
LGRSLLRENIILGTMSGPASAVSILIPLYLNHLGYPVGAIGAVLAVAAVATLLSRTPAPRLYRPERSRLLVLVTLVGGGATFAILPFLENLMVFGIVLIANRALYGLATTIFLARYMDLIATQGANRRQAMGWYGGIQAIGYTSSNVLVGVSADVLGYTAAFLYGTIFTVFAVVPLIGAMQLPPKPAAQARDDRPRSAGMAGWLHGVADPGLWSVLNVNTWNNILHLTLVSFFPVYATAIGLGAAQIGIARGLYSGINAVGRPLAGAALAHLSLRQVSYVSLAIIAALLFVLPLVQTFALIVLVFVGMAAVRAIIVVANSAALAEEVDETRVSRGAATSSYSASGDVANIAAPAASGFIASIFGVFGMYSIVAAGVFGCFVAGDLVIQRWRARVRQRSLAEGVA